MLYEYSMIFPIPKDISVIYFPIILSYSSTTILAFTSQESSICLCLQFSDKCFNNSLLPSNSFKIRAKSRADWEGFDKAIFLPTESSITADMPQASKQTTGKRLLTASNTTVEVSSFTLVKKNN